MSRVKIEDLKPPAKDLDVKEMKKLFGGTIALYQPGSIQQLTWQGPGTAGRGSTVIDDWEAGSSTPKL
jgi:hypothetical protein